MQKINDKIKRIERLKQDPVHFVGKDAHDMLPQFTNQSNKTSLDNNLSTWKCLFKISFNIVNMFNPDKPGSAPAESCSSSVFKLLQTLKYF